MRNLNGPALDGYAHYPSSIHDNPHKYGSEAAQQWLDGWLQGARADYAVMHLIMQSPWEGGSHVD